MTKTDPLTIPILEQVGFAQIAKLRHLKVRDTLVSTC